MSLRAIAVGLTTFAAGLMPVCASAEMDFRLNALQFEHTELKPEPGMDLDGIAGQFRFALSDNTWIRLERETLEPADQPSGTGPEWQFTSAMLGVGAMITDRGMWYLESGVSEVRLENGPSERSGAFALGIRTRISPRFELGGGPRFGAVHRLRPGEDDALMRVHGTFRIFDGLGLSGSYDYNDEYRQWRLGLRLAW